MQKKKNLFLLLLTATSITSSILFIVNNRTLNISTKLENQSLNIELRNRNNMILYNKELNFTAKEYLSRNLIQVTSIKEPQSKSKTFTFNLSFNDFIKKYFIGNHRSINQNTNKPYSNNVILSRKKGINNTKDTSLGNDSSRIIQNNNNFKFVWERIWGYWWPFDWERGYFYFFPFDSYAFDKIIIKDNHLMSSFSDSSCSFEDKNGDDVSKFNTNFSYFLNDNNDIEIKIYIYCYSLDNSWTGGSHVESNIFWLGANLMSSNLKLLTDVELPYSKYDLENFKELFRQIFAKPFKFSGNSPIIFDYLDPSKPNQYTENEQRVRKEVEKRIKEFYRNESILNKLGAISRYGNSTGVTNVELVVPTSARGKVGNLPNQISIKLKLNPGEEFYFDANKASNFIEVKFPIYVELDPTIDYSINELVEITPYKSAGNDLEDNWVTKRDFQFRLGENDPNPLAIKSFNKNINEPIMGIYPLIPIEKFPSVNHWGMILQFELNINIDNKKFIKKEIKFNRLFNNGKTFIDVNFLQGDFDDVWIKDLKIKLGLEMNKDKINIFNASPIKLDTTLSNNEIENKKVVLEIKNAKYTLPKEQSTVYSKWIQEKEGVYNDANSNVNKPDFVGQWKTYDPFYFKLRAREIPVYDPITGQQVGYASKYKPFIRQGLYDPKGNNYFEESKDTPIFPQPSDNKNEALYLADFGPYFMKNKTENGQLEIQIVVKEYDQKTQDYNKERWIMNIRMELLAQQVNFEMVGYKDNELIKNENEEKYFNKESEYYRGDYVNQNTGMYIPKIVWVNSYPPESFLYDPLDENGNKLSKQEENDKDNIRYDIGYIAQLNATGFTSHDYGSNPSFGGYETNFDVNIFKPTGLIPYSEFYTFNKNSLVPKIEKVPLSKSGLQTIKSTADFRQIVLKRPTSNMFLYQFVKISTNDEIQKYKNDLISLYGQYNGLKDKPLFVDFWDTYHGKNLKTFLVDKYKLIESEDALRELEYYDVIQYWNIYVNSPELNDNENDKDKNNSLYNIDKLEFVRQIVSIQYLDVLRKQVINKIEKQLNDELVKKGWTSENLIWNTHFKIEETNEMFENKLKLLLNEYDKPINESKTIEFNIIIIDSAFENKLIKITGSKKIQFLNNKDADKVIDLSNYNGGRININTSKEPLLSSNNLVKDVKYLILNAIKIDWIKIIKNSEFSFEDSFIPELGKHYEMKFYTKIYQNNSLVNYYYPTIEKAIKDVLLYQIKEPFFDNNLYIEIIAKNNNETNFMKNSFAKLVNNNANNKNIDFIDAFNLKDIKSKDLKINTKDPDFPEKDESKKAEFIFNLLLERVYHDIIFWARKWINLNNETIDYKTNYELRFIKNKNDFGEIIYYDNHLKAINEVLLLNLENNFNRDLYVEVVATNDSNNWKTQGSFIKKINNNYLNKAIEEDKYDDLELDDSISGDDTNNPDISNPTENLQVNLSNQRPPDSSLNLWWIITPATILFIIITSAVIVFIIRKNRRIR